MDSITTNSAEGFAGSGIAYNAVRTGVGIQMNDTTNLSGVTVMVIDDSNTIRRSAEIFLKQAGCAVVLAEDGFDGLGKIVEHKPDIVFCDIMMPRLDGYQTCMLLRQNPAYQSIPFIMLSSKDGLFDRARGALAGSTQYLTKPFTRDTLISAVASNRPVSN